MRTRPARFYAIALLLAGPLWIAHAIRPAYCGAQSPDEGAYDDGQRPAGEAATAGSAPAGYPGVVPGTGNPPPRARATRAARANRLMTWPGFQFRPDGASRFFVQTNQPIQVESRRTGGRFIVVLKNTRIHLRNNRNPLETRFFNTPVTRAHVERHGRDVWLVLTMRADVTPQVHSEAGPGGYHFVYVELPAGSFLPPPTPVPQGGLSIVN